MRSVFASFAFSSLLLAAPSFAEPLKSLEVVPAATPTNAETTSPPTTPTKDTPAGTPEKKKARDANAKFGVLGALGFPRPLSIEAMINVEESVAIGIEYGYLPSIKVDGADVHYHAIAGDLRVFPLKSPFFLGARLGKQHVDASGTMTVSGYGTYNESMSIDAWFVNPRLGFLWTHSSGITIGMDVGLQIPISHTESSTVPAALQAKAPQSITTVTTLFGTSVLPTVSLLQIGMLI